MRVLLVKPFPELNVAKCLQKSFLHLEPLELEIVAGGISNEDTCVILDLSVEKRPRAAFDSMLDSFKPEIVGFSCYSTNVNVVKELCRKTKAVLPRAVTLVGGVHATLLPQDFAVASVDAIVRGEGGIVMTELIRRVKNHTGLSFDNRVLAIADPDFADQAALPPPAYPEASEIPMPRRDLVRRDRYFCIWTSSETGRLERLFPQVASLRTSIGCAYRCSFCVIHHLMHGKYLQRQPEEVVDEIAQLEEDYIYFVDDEMFLNPKRVTRIAEILLERNVKKHFISWARSDTIVKHPDVFQTWRRAGLETLYVGLESMDPSRLTEYDKRTTAETNRKAVELLRDWGITLHAAFIVNPDFSEADFDRLEADVKAVCPAEVTFTVLSPSPGTAFWHERKEEFICDPFAFYDCMHTVLPTHLPLKKFYARFGRLTAIALRANPLRARRMRVPVRDFFRAFSGGIRYISSLYQIYRDYPRDQWK